MGDKPAQLPEQVQPEVLNKPKEISASENEPAPGSGDLTKAGINRKSADTIKSISASQTKWKVKNNNNPATAKKDSVAAPPAQISATIINDSLKQNSFSQSDMHLSENQSTSGKLCQPGDRSLQYRCFWRNFEFSGYPYEQFSRDAGPGIGQCGVYTEQ